MATKSSNRYRPGCCPLSLDLFRGSCNPPCKEAPKYNGQDDRAPFAIVRQQLATVLNDEESGHFQAEKGECSVSEPQWQLFFCIELPTAGTTGLYGLLSSPDRYIPQAFPVNFYSAGPPAGYWPVPVLHARTCSARALFLIIYRGLV